MLLEMENDFDIIEKNLKSSRRHITQFEENLKALQVINRYKTRMDKIKKIKRICDELSNKTPYELVNIFHFVLFFLAFGIHLMDLNLEKNKRRNSFNFLKSI